MRAFIRFIVAHAWLTLAITALSAVLAAWGASRLEVSFQYRDFYDYPANPKLEDLRAYTKDFGDPAGYVIGFIRAPDVFTPRVMRYVDELTSALEREPLFVKVHSLSNASSIQGTPDGVTAGRIMTAVPASLADSQVLRSKALDSPLLVRRVVSADGTATAVMAEMRTPAAMASIAVEAQALAAFRRVVLAHPAPPGLDFRVTGAPAVELETTRSLIHDQLTLMPAVAAVLLVTLFFIFRSVQGVLMPASAVGLALLWTAGGCGFIGYRIDILGSVVATILLVYGVVDPIFVLNRYLDKLGIGLSRNEAIVEALGELALPCFLTSTTTAFGFFAFASAVLPTVRGFGTVVGIGVLFAWVTTVTLLPALLTLVPVPARVAQGLDTSRRVAVLLEKLWRRLRDHSPAILVSATLLLALGLGYARRQHIVNEYVGQLPAGEVQDTVRELEKKLSGVMRSVVYIRGPSDSMLRPDVLKAIDAVDHFAEQQPMVSSSISLSDLIAQEHQAFSGGDPSDRKVPDSPNLIAQYLAMTEPEDRADFVTDDYSRTHIRILAEDHGSESFNALMQQIQSEVDTRFAGLGVQATLTGSGVLSFAGGDRAVIDMLIGFPIAFVIVLVFQALLFRSFSVALIGVIPNLCPVVACFMVMRAAAIPLRIDNAVVLCVSVGGLFNTTIHFAARALQHLARGDRDPDQIVEQSLVSIGPPALFTAAVLCAGFTVLTLSRFPGLRMLGLLSMITLVVGLVSDMVITAASLKLLLRWRLRHSPIPASALSAQGDP